VPAFGEPREELERACRRKATGARDRGEIFLDGQRLENVALLRDPADTGGRALIRPQRRQRLSHELDVAAEVTSDAEQRA
jgi:hypothetical protein